MNTSKPLHYICVPLTETAPEPFLSALHTAAQVADVVELRLDYLSDGARAQVFAQLPALAAQITTPLLFTFRPREQGGQRELSLAARRAFWQQLPAEIAALVGFADFELDLVESFTAEPPPVPWSKVICSWHNFDHTPEDLIQRYERMAATPAAIVKLATKCNRIGDCLRLFELIEHAQGRKPLIALGMGLPGLSTRVLSLSRGALLTFGALQRGAESAPGQPTVNDLNQLYRTKQLTPASQVFGVIGQPIGHSRSPLIHNPALQAAGIDGVYLPLEVNDTASFLRDFVHPKTRQLNWNLVAGSNAFYVNKSNHFVEGFVGLENILKLFRVDYVVGYSNNQRITGEVRIGAGGLLGSSVRVNAAPGRRNGSLSITF